MIVVAVYTHTSLTSKKVNRKKKHFYRSSNFIHKIRESEAAGDKATVKMFFLFRSRVTFLLYLLRFIRSQIKESE